MGLEGAFRDVPMGSILFSRLNNVARKISRAVTPWQGVLGTKWRFYITFICKKRRCGGRKRCKANARVKLAKSGHGPHLFRIVICVVLVIVLCYCLYAVLLLLCCTVIVLLCYYLCCPMYWFCVLYHCHRVLTQLQSTNISISIYTMGHLGGGGGVFRSKLHCGWMFFGRSGAVGLWFSYRLLVWQDFFQIKWNRQVFSG